MRDFDARAIGENEPIGVMVIELPSQRHELEVYDACYGVVDRDRLPDLIEFAGDRVSLSAAVAQGAATARARSENYRGLIGLSLPLNAWSAAFDDPFLDLAGIGSVTIQGGYITIEAVRGDTISGSALLVVGGLGEEHPLKATFRCRLTLAV